MNNRNQRGYGFSILLLGLLLLAMFFLFTNQSPSSIEYYEMKNLFKDEKVTSFRLNLSTGEMTYTLDGEDGVYYQYNVPDVGIFISDVSGYIDSYNQNHQQELQYDYYVSSSLLGTLLSMLPTLILTGALIYFIVTMSRQGRGGFSAISKAKTRQAPDMRTATFADVAGADEEKAELGEIVEYLKDPGQFNALGAKIPKGVLLVGPPGTGKTLLARAVAGEAGVPFFSISGSDFVELYVGVGASRVRDLFDRAKKAAPSIIFIDEIDAAGRRRGTGLGGGNDEREQTLNQLLVEMDGFAGKEGVIVIGATNRADVLDPALLRPGRFDRSVYVGYPDVKGREEILKVHARNKPLGPDVDLSVIAKTTIGFTGADLENLMNEAALLAARKKRRAIVMQDLDEAAVKVIVGPEKKSRVVSEKERKLTAYHEAGHAVSTYYKTPETPVHEVSIIPRGSAGGYTMSLPSDDVNFTTKSQMVGQIVTLLGGRVAEQLVLDDVSTGASNDLQRATKIANSMVTKYGFSEKLGPVAYDDHDEVFLGRDFTQSRTYSEQIAGEIDNEVRRIIDSAYSACRDILSEHIDKLHGVANALLKCEKLSGEEFKKYMESENGEFICGGRDQLPEPQN